MRVAIVYGSRKHGSTHYCVERVKDQLESCGEVEFEEIWLQKELPEFCKGCVNCIIESETLCPHFEAVASIEQRIMASDGIIMASPVYGFNVSGIMKNFIDHFCYRWMVHRPHPEMFNKVAFLITTAAGGGIKKTINAMKTPIGYMGAKRILTYGKAVAAAKPSEISGKKKKQMEKSLKKKANQFYNLLEKGNAVTISLKSRILFNVFAGMIKSYDDTNKDKLYWQQQGWYKGIKPYK